MPHEDHLLESDENMDRRQAARHYVERPCRVEAESLAAEASSGLTTNVSRSGILVRLPEVNSVAKLPKIGEQARVEIDLPPSRKYTPRALECLGRVVRVEEQGENAPAVALELDRMHIRDLPQKSRRKRRAATK